MGAAWARLSYSTFWAAVPIGMHVCQVWGQANLGQSAHLLAGVRAKRKQARLGWTTILTSSHEGQGWGLARLG